MPADLNRVTLVGRLTRDPELRHTGGGDPICSIRLAVSSRARDEGGNWGDKLQLLRRDRLRPPGPDGRRLPGQGPADRRGRPAVVAGVAGPGRHQAPVGRGDRQRHLLPRLPRRGRRGGGARRRAGGAAAPTTWRRWAPAARERRAGGGERRRPTTRRSPSRAIPARGPRACRPRGLAAGPGGVPGLPALKSRFPRAEADWVRIVAVSRLRPGMRLGRPVYSCSAGVRVPLLQPQAVVTDPCPAGAGARRRVRGLRRRRAVGGDRAHRGDLARGAGPGAPGAARHVQRPSPPRGRRRGSPGSRWSASRASSPGSSASCAATATWCRR